MSCVPLQICVRGWRASGLCLLGPRQLRRLFAEQTGLSPRSMIQIMRFQRALDEFVKAPDQTPSEYFDQAHWIKECKRFTGMTPGSLRRALIARMSDSYNEGDRLHATLTL
ncbi:MAG: AraC family transcriptional regulator [Leptonema illini]|uniref:AraC family transcriptional regulator n=1 Tax=Leptonema illini TaxID=183 RepID=A0A833M0K6_9LEPT|nr:MAG: AraC family transcriptional regulator [Leptonema illini]